MVALDLKCMIFIVLGALLVTIVGVIELRENHRKCSLVQATRTSSVFTGALLILTYEDASDGTAERHVGTF